VNIFASMSTSLQLCASKFQDFPGPVT